MHDPEQQQKLDELREEFCSIRAEFYAAKEQLSRACQTVTSSVEAEASKINYMIRLWTAGAP